MIEKISSAYTTPLPLLQKGIEKRNGYITTPKNISVTNTLYSSENVKANYMPVNISFGSGKNLPAVVNPAPAKNLKHTSNYKGAYYDSIADDTAIMLGTNKDLIFTVKNGVDAEIFANNFADRVNDNKYSGMDFSKNKTDVVYIENPEEFTNQNMDMNRFLMQMNRESDNKHRVVIINNFDKFIDSAGYEGKPDMQNYMSLMYPKLNVIGIVNDDILISTITYLLRPSDSTAEMSCYNLNVCSPQNLCTEALTSTVTTVKVLEGGPSEGD